MKKNFLILAALFLGLGIMASCSGKNAEKEREDSISMADSLAAIETAQAAAEQARLDSIKQDSINNASSALNFSMFCKPEKVDGVSLQSFLPLKKIKANLEEIGFTQTGSKKEKEKDYDWTPENPTYYTKTVTTFSRTVGEKTINVELEGSEGYVGEAEIEFPNEEDVNQFKETVTGKLKDSKVYWHELYVRYKGNKVEIEAGGGE